jgi:hypothetical protein
MKPTTLEGGGLSSSDAGKKKRAENFEGENRET